MQRPQRIATCPGAARSNGIATVSFTLVADTLPANPSILSFKVTILGIALTPTTGTAQTLSPSSSIVDLMRLQSDTALLDALTNVPSGTYTVQVSLSSPEIAFLNDTGSAITANGKTCLTGIVCTAILTAVGTPTIGSFTFNAFTGGQQGIESDFNLKNAISLTSGTLSANLNPSSPNPGVFTAFTLPRTNANLGTNQLELIVDFTSVVSISGSTITISLDDLICPTASAITCVVSGRLTLNGTFESKSNKEESTNELAYARAICGHSPCCRRNGSSRSGPNAEPASEFCAFSFR